MEHLRPGSVRERRPPNSDIDRPITVNGADAKPRWKKGAREETTRYRPPGLPYPMRAKPTDGGARERSREEAIEGVF